jgi:hypothetical protein
MRLLASSCSKGCEVTPRKRASLLKTSWRREPQESRWVPMRFTNSRPRSDVRGRITIRLPQTVWALFSPKSHCRLIIGSGTSQRRRTSKTVVLDCP